MKPALYVHHPWMFGRTDKEIFGWLHECGLPVVAGKIRRYKSFVLVHMPTAEAVSEWAAYLSTIEGVTAEACTRKG